MKKTLILDGFIGKRIQKFKGEMIPVIQTLSGSRKQGTSAPNNFTKQHTLLSKSDEKFLKRKILDCRIF